MNRHRKSASHYTAVTMRSAVMALIIIVTFTGCARFTSIRQSAEFQNQMQGQQTITILPPAVVVSERIDDYKYNRLDDEAEKLEIAFNDYLEDAVTKKHYKVVPSVIQNDLDATQAIGKGYNWADNKMRSLLDMEYAYGTHKKIEEAYAMDEVLPKEVTDILQVEKADLLVFVQYGRVQNSSKREVNNMATDLAARVLAGLVVDVPPGTYTDSEAYQTVWARVALIKKSTGEVLWLNKKNKKGSWFSDVDTGFMDSLMEDFPELP